MIANWPVVIFAFDGTHRRAPLRMALDTGIAGLNIIHSRWIQNVYTSWMLDVRASRTVAFLASNVPLRHLFRVYVVVHRMATVTSRPRGPLHVVRWIKRLPPIRPLGHEILPPDVPGNVPLRRLRKIIVSSFREVTLLPDAAVNQRDNILRKLGNAIRRKIGNDRLGMFPRIAHHIRHRCLSPVFVNLRVALLARLRANVASRIRRGHLFLLLFLAWQPQAADEQHQLPPIIALLVVRFRP